jgi:hypothetical protein
VFEWLEQEMSQIKTNKFHLVDGPASRELKQAVEGCELPLPASYRNFVLRFGLQSSIDLAQDILSAYLLRRGNRQPKLVSHFFNSVGLGLREHFQRELVSQWARFTGIRVLPKQFSQNGRWL